VNFTVVPVPTQTPVPGTATPRVSALIHPVRRTHPHPFTVPLTIHVTPGRVVSGGILTIQAQTAARARMQVLLRVVTVQIHGGGGRGKKTTQTSQVVLYHATLNGSADRRGRYSGRLRLVSTLPTSLAALLTVRATAGRSTTTRTAGIQLLP